MNKALMVATTASMIDQFNMSNISVLQKLGYEVSVACNFMYGNTTSDIRIKEFKKELEIQNVKYYNIEFPRSPYHVLKLIHAYLCLKNIICRENFVLIHCHTPVGGLLGRLAANKNRKVGKTTVIYTAHGFHFFKGSPLRNWLFYFPIEWVLSHWTDMLITINKEDYRLAKRFMKARKVEYIPGVGIDMKKLSDVQIGRDEMRKALGAAQDDYVLLSVGELSKRKNVSVVIKALNQIKNSRLKYYICGTGSEEESLKGLIHQYGLEDQVHLLGYRSDIKDLLKASDLFVFPSLQEGLPVALMEAIATRTPVICSDIRGNTDLITEKDLLFDPNNEQSVIQCLKAATDRDMTNVIERHYEALKNYNLKTVSEKMGMNYSTLLQRYPETTGGVMALYERQTILQELGQEGWKYILLSVGELSSRKNQETVIEALNRLHRTDILYLIAGVGHMADRFRMLIQKYGLKNQVYLLGYRSDIGRLCDFSDIFVHISVREGLGMAPLEAMTKGMPLISSYVNGMKDYTLDGITGNCIDDPTSIDETAQAILSMIQNENEWSAYSTINHMIAKHFEGSRNQARIEDIYRQAGYE